ncbi:CDP-alcohol phosphatidyltransferase family protein [Microlunatus phosphovorus]|uniref:CDP-alcohol phosphatidyltransferase family protein n=1 Tax=Microlunatus phosphovorus TaxID=29405 RepID=UPI0012EA1A68|nr:CDP-alcohol phosphatidyltransferase family protein [Microlunatus phosphovorus]
MTRPWQPVAAGALVEGAGLVVAGGAGLVMPAPALVAALGYVGGAAAILTYWGKRRLGAANLVTLARVIGTCWVIGLTLEAWFGHLGSAGLLVMIVIGVCCLILDGLDGAIARHRGEASAFGARFDMETDAALLMSLSLAVSTLGIAGWWVLAIGLMRYAYVAAAWIGPARLRSALRLRLPYRYSRKVIAVVQGVALLAALAVEAAGLNTRVPMLPTLLLAPALALLTWSFGRDVIWQLTRLRTI